MPHISLAFVAYIAGICRVCRWHLSRMSLAYAIDVVGICRGRRTRPALIRNQPNDSTDEHGEDGIDFKAKGGKEYGNTESDAEYKEWQTC